LTDDLASSITTALMNLGEERPADGFLVVPIDGAPDWRVGCDADGRTVLLGPREDPTWPSVLLSNLRFNPALSVLTISPDGTKQEMEVSTIIVDGAAAGVSVVLSAALAGLITAAGLAPKKGDIARAVGGLRDLFQSLTTAGRSAYLGVWGELLLMVLAADPRTLALAWGSDPRQVFDFALAGHRLEVKTTQQVARRHHFSYAQLLASESTSVVVASLQTLAVPDGSSAADLLSLLLHRLSGDTAVASRVLERATHALGANLTDVDAPRFDRGEAEETLALHNFADIPRVTLQPGVVDVTWVAELTGAGAAPTRNALVSALLGSVAT
jgi:Putative  PD-(D/E)XK family member, (DUF4420)